MADIPDIQVSADGDEMARRIAELLLIHVVSVGAAGYEINLTLNGCGQLDGETFTVSVNKRKC